MKAKNYDIIDTLPDNAKTVKRYANEVGLSHAYIYVKYERNNRNENTTGYRIVRFQDINFVIPTN